jgi:hypothetical protein
MTFEKFKELTDLMIENNKKLSDSHRLGIDLYEVCEPQEKLIHSLWDIILTDFGLDWFSWFMYEKNYIDDGIGRCDINAYDGGSVICEDLKGLYDYLVENNYFKIPLEDAKPRN